MKFPRKLSKNSLKIKWNYLKNFKKRKTLENCVKLSLKVKFSSKFCKIHFKTTRNSLKKWMKFP